VSYYFLKTAREEWRFPMNSSPRSGIMQLNIKLTIEQVAELVGVSKSTLRQWEKVYAVHPERSAGNHRRYRQGQLDIMLKIKALYDEGFALQGIKARLQAVLEESVLRRGNSEDAADRPRTEKRVCDHES
jgi:MerR family transcriptional regulator, heat shock protein HspR